MTPTPEQESIISFLRDDPRSLLISALAGAAKTSTLVLGAHAMPVLPTLACAFNKKIADEMAKRFPSHVTSATMNSLGHRAWGAALGKRLTLNADKMYTLTLAESERATGADKSYFSENFASILRATRLAKSSGYIPASMATLGKTLCTEDEFIDTLAPQLDSNPDPQFLHFLNKILAASIGEAFSGVIDFDDQIYMSTLFGGQYTKYPVVLVDEAQDLSPLNHMALSRMVANRLVAVGDPNQAIYGFRGAHASSMAVLKDQFQMEELSLSVSFRCPKAVVEVARRRAPHMSAPDWAKPGHVERLGAWTCAAVPDGAVIICRNNAPLFSVAMRLIRAGRGVQVVGADLGKSLILLLEKLGGKGVNCDQRKLLFFIDSWEEEELSKARDSRKAAIRDRAECLRVFCEFGADKAEISAYAKHLFSSKGPIQLMTGHKSKGLEFDVVYFLDSFLIPSKFSLRLAEEGNDAQYQQELNLRYVIETRSKDQLYYVTSEDLQ